MCTTTNIFVAASVLDAWKLVISYSKTLHISIFGNYGILALACSGWLETKAEWPGWISALNNDKIYNYIPNWQTNVWYTFWLQWSYQNIFIFVKTCMGCLYEISDWLSNGVFHNFNGLLTFCYLVNNVCINLDRKNINSPGRDNIILCPS